jgi:hypothetical protein
MTERKTRATAKDKGKNKNRSFASLRMTTIRKPGVVAGLLSFAP